MIKAVVYDLDGTLLDTSRDIAKVLNDALREFGLSELPLERVIKIVGGGAEKLVKQAVDKEVDYKKVLKVFCEKYANNGNGLTSFYDGEEEILQKLSARGIKMAILTNKPHRATMAVFAKFLAKFGFCEVLGQTEYYPVKPDPASLFAILSKMNVNANDCVFVGDGETDVQTARNASMRCVSALWGYRSKDELKAAGAEEFAENFADLYDKICG